MILKRYKAKYNNLLITTVAYHTLSSKKKASMQMMVRES